MATGIASSRRYPTIVENFSGLSERINKVEVTTMAKIALFASGQAGLKIVTFLSSSRTDEIVALRLAGANPELDSSIRNAAGIGVQSVRSGKQSHKDEAELFNILGVDTILSVYWPWKIGADVLEVPETTVNFHPALLPSGRGWYPHVHNLIDGTPAGVTLHELSFPLDSGKIWAQEKVITLPEDTAGSLHLRLQERIVGLFIEKWEDIASGRIRPSQQEDSLANYHKINALDNLDCLNVDAEVRVGKLLDLLRARTFGSRGFAYFEENGERIYLRLDLSRDSGFGRT